MTDEELVVAFATRRQERLKKEWGSYAPRNPVASDLADCRRYQVMRIFGWKVRSEPDQSGLEAIEHGRDLEPIVISDLMDEGWEVVRLQEPFEIRQPIPRPNGPKKLVVRGKIDGMVNINGEFLPFDAKATSEYVLNSVATEEDLQRSPWTRKWWRQMQIYLLGIGLHERALLVLAHRGQRKVVVVHLDYQAAEELLQLCEWTVALAEELEAEGVDETTINAALLAREIPYHHAYSECVRCPFHERACFPPSPAPGTVQMREDLAEVVTNYVVAKRISTEADRLYREIKQQTEGFETTIAGDFIIDGEVRTRRMKAQPAKPEHVKEYWHFEIRSVREGSE